MAIWLMASSIHGSDINSIHAGRPWPYRVSPNNRLHPGDLVYLPFGDSGLYAWGYITGIERYQDQGLDRQMMKLLVSRPVVQAGLVSAREINQTQEIAGITQALEGNFASLTPQQCNALNRLIRLHGAQAPADVSELEDQIGPFGVRNTASLAAKLGQAVEQYKMVSVRASASPARLRSYRSRPRHFGSSATTGARLSGGGTPSEDMSPCRLHHTRHTQGTIPAS